MFKRQKMIDKEHNNCTDKLNGYQFDVGKIGKNYGMKDLRNQSAYNHWPRKIIDEHKEEKYGCHE